MRLNGRFVMIGGAALLALLGSAILANARPMLPDARNVVARPTDSFTQIRPDFDLHGIALQTPSPLLDFTPFVSESEVTPVLPSGRHDSLEDVLRSMVNVQSSMRLTRQSPLQQLGTGVDEGQNALDRAIQAAYIKLLNSELLGTALRDIIQTEVDQRRKTFSILGMGHFEVNADSGQLNLSENWTGASLSLPNDRAQEAGGLGDLAQKPAVASSTQEGQLAVFTVFRRFLSLFDGPEGTLLVIILALILVPAGALRMLMRLARRRPRPLRATR